MGDWRGEEVKRRTFIGKNLGDDGASYVEKTGNPGSKEGRRRGRETCLGEEYRSVLCRKLSKSHLEKRTGNRNVHKARHRYRMPEQNGQLTAS